MLLDRIDIDSHGPLTRVALGPFSHGLNAIVAASGTGKTALVRFLRDSLTGTTPAREGLSQSTGRVIWKAADGFYHCRRTPNGTPQGHRFVEFETRFPGTARLGRDSIVVDLPACVVDGIVTDTALTSVQHCIQAAILSGLDHNTTTSDSSHDLEIKDLRREIASLEEQIHSHKLHSQHASARPAEAYESYGLTLDMKRLRDRRAELSLEISAIDARRDWAAKADAEMERRRSKRELFATIADEIERLRRHESDLRLRLAEADAKWEQMNEEACRAASRGSIAKAYRNRLEQVDAQLVRVRHVVREIRALGDHWFGGRDVTAQAGWLAQAIDDVNHVADTFVRGPHSQSVENAEHRSELEINDRGWSAAFASQHRHFTAPSASTADVQRRIDAICRLVDNLVGRYEEHQSTSRLSFGHETDTDPVRAIGRMHMDSWAETELDRHDHRRGAADPSPTADPAQTCESFEPISGLDRAERLLQEERTYRAGSLSQSSENLAWIAGVLNGVSQRLRGLAGRHVGYGASNIEPLFPSAAHDACYVEPGVPSGSSDFGTLLDPHAQVAAVRRCERELVEVLRRLVARREVMARRIAEVQDQPLSRVLSSLDDSQVCDDDPQLYQWLLRERITASESDAKRRDAAQRRLEQQRANLTTELKQTLGRMTDRVAEADSVRLYLRSLPVVPRHDDDAALRARLVAEIRAIDEQLARPRIHPSVLERHAQCVTRLRSLTLQGPESSGLAAVASEHLSNLSSGRMRSITWRRSANATMPRHVEIDGRNENDCSAAERFVAAVAVRLAAADELDKRGRSLPIIIETPSRRPLPGAAFNQDLRSLLQTSIEVLAKMAQRGRQFLILTDDAVVADAVMRAGGSVQSMRGSSTTSEPIHNEVWTRHDRPALPTEHMFEVNRDLDFAWREANGDDVSWRSIDRPAESPASDGDQLLNLPVAPEVTRTRFDLPAGNNTEEGRPADPWHRNSDLGFATASAPKANGRAEAADTPFFLSGHDAIERAPSIATGQAQRLRAVGVTRVEHLLAASPKELAATLKIDTVDAVIVRRWQHECRLVCGVRKLRAFDARVLVGCGITHPRELSEIDPAALVEKVEAFLSTDSGVKILRSGSPQETARLMAWLEQAKLRARATPAGRSDKPLQKAAAVAAGNDHRPVSAKGRDRSSRKEDDDREPALRFYLHRSSDVEAAPSIGPRMAERLRRIGVRTVKDLVTRSASSIAADLKMAKVDADSVRQWQQQATLICRVPLLRGHDAQLLVAAGITEAERLAACDADWLFSQIEPIAKGREGKLIIRNGQRPDLAEVRAWIANAQRHRELVAA